MRHIPEMVLDDLSFLFPPNFLLFCMARKLLGWTKYTFYQGSITYYKKMSFQSGQILLDISYCTTWLTLPCDLKYSLMLFLPIPSLKWWFHLFWFLYIDKHNVKRGRGEMDRQQLINSKHEGKHKIGYHPNSFLMFTAYQL